MLRYVVFKKMCGENLDQIVPYVMLVYLCVMLRLRYTFVCLEARITFLVLAGPSSMAVHVQYCAASPTLWGEQKPHNMALLCNHVITNNH